MSGKRTGLWAMPASLCRPARNGQERRAAPNLPATAKSATKKALLSIKSWALKKQTVSSALQSIYKKMLQGVFSEYRGPRLLYPE